MLLEPGSMKPAASAAGHRGDRAQRAGAGPAHRRSARPEPHHVRADPARRAAGRAARGRADGDRLGRATAPTPRACGWKAVLDPRPRSYQRDQRPLAAGGVEPAQQRDQVHAQGRQGPGRAAARELAHRIQRQRHRDRHSGELSSPRVRAVLAEGQLDDAEVRRAGTGARHLQAAGGAAWRLHPGNERGEGQGATFFVELPLVDRRSSKTSRLQRVHPTRRSRLPRSSSFQGSTACMPSSSTTKPIRASSSSASCEQGATVTRASTRREEALAALRDNSRPSSISDIGMPNMDGYQFMRRLARGRSRRRAHPRSGAHGLRSAGRPKEVAPRRLPGAPRQALRHGGTDPRRRRPGRPIGKSHPT